MKNRKERYLLSQLYRLIPNANCKGLCTEACSMIGFTKPEGNEMVRASGGVQPFLTDDAVCGYLVEGRCSVYEARPAICRLFGVSQKLQCPFGCKPDGGIMPEEQAEKILLAIDKLGDGKMYSNISKLQAVNMRLDRPLSAPLKDMHVKGADTIVPYVKKD